MSEKSSEEFRGELELAYAANIAGRGIATAAANRQLTDAELGKAAIAALTVNGFRISRTPDPRAKNLAEILDLCVETLNAAGLELKDTNPKAAEVIGKVLRIARADLSEWEGGK